MLCANDDNNDSNNAGATTVPQSIWNSEVFKFEKYITSSLLSSFTSKADVTVMNNNNRNEVIMVERNELVVT